MTRRILDPDTSLAQVYEAIVALDEVVTACRYELHQIRRLLEGQEDRIVIKMQDQEVVKAGG